MFEVVVSTSSVVDSVGLGGTLGGYSGGDGVAGGSGVNGGDGGCDGGGGKPGVRPTTMRDWDSSSPAYKRRFAKEGGHAG